MDLKVLLGLNLKHYRKEKHLSQEELSEKIDISAKHLSKIERGLAFVSAELLEKISDHLEISVALLFCKANEKIYNESVISMFDRIAEKNLIKALEEIKADTRKNYYSSDRLIHD